MTVRGRMIAVGTLAVAMLAGCGDLETADGVNGSGDDAGKSVDVGEAREELAKLEVKGRAPKTGFDRDEFGPAWSDVDHNGCDTRNDILKRDLSKETFKAGTDCVILTGTLDDPYSGKTIDFERGQSTSMKVQIDHVVGPRRRVAEGRPEAEPVERKELANDPLNLLAVDGPLNSQKGAGDAATGCRRAPVTAAPTSPVRST